MGERRADTTTITHIGERGTIVIGLTNGQRHVLRPKDAITVDWWGVQSIEPSEEANLICDLELLRHAT